ncbi:hypothetical protein KQX54_000603 [Cotesia glomerata]|uniref:Uncharacterized protein n=1 Tax=Cotesia glomerata TaxID=32391 RepID=A0AAV7J145_COTGL|nr:hypothetical protein KQX54_000603 [Cotesia glomerata]
MYPSAGMNAAAVAAAAAARHPKLNEKSEKFSYGYCIEGKEDPSCISRERRADPGKLRLWWIGLDGELEMLDVGNVGDVGMALIGIRAGSLSCLGGLNDSSTQLL